MCLILLIEWFLMRMEWPYFLFMFVWRSSFHCSFWQFVQMHGPLGWTKVSLIVHFDSYGQFSRPSSFALWMCPIRFHSILPFQFANAWTIFFNYVFASTNSVRHVYSVVFLCRLLVQSMMLLSFSRFINSIPCVVFVIRANFATTTTTKIDQLVRSHCKNVKLHRPTKFVCTTFV